MVGKPEAGQKPGFGPEMISGCPSSDSSIESGPFHGFPQTIETLLPQQFLNGLLELSLVHNSRVR
jgi:hypothetical protein